MRPAALVSHTRQLLYRIATMNTSTLNGSVRHLLDSNVQGIFFRCLSTQSFSGQDALRFGRDFTSFGDVGMRGKVFYTSASKFDPSILQRRRAAELDEEERLRVELHPSKLLQKGTPGTVQGIIRDVMPVGYFVTLPNGKEGYLPYTELGCSGGIFLLERLFKVGQEITVKVIRNTQGGRDICKVKPDKTDAPPTATASSGGSTMGPT